MCYSPIKNRRICWKHKKEKDISYIKQLAFEGRKSYEQPSPKCKKNYKETELIPETKKAELLAKRRIKSLKTNMEK
ncbi:hypothetical protein RhiirA4_488525 [Rhizophagus irregularis]|uniref:Uncharacterized protein n=1 Tax=Rhizophagus irregularis TaxID=588596 RepID=A0A2I1HTU3_9GLOM|nr:hypothetical protein RhiirA4_488525 [Rhizophagus irregularis]